MVARKLITALALAVPMTAVLPLQANDLTVSISNIAGPGVLMLKLFGDESQFNGDTPPHLALRQQLDAGEFTFTTSGLPDGEYGLRLMYDTNGNGELDSNMIGMPTEPWGFSNNATGNFGPPSWTDIKFSVNADTRQVIDLNR